MAISFKRYIDIVSGIGAGTRVAGRDLIGRVFSVNPLIPMDMLVEFEEAAEAAEFFGAESGEYQRAAFYFGFISKTQTRPRRLGFARWAQADAPATLRGAFAVPALAQFQTVADGSLRLTLDGNGCDITGLSFAGAASYADVASILQSGIRAAAEAPLWAQSTVSYEARLKGFIFSAGQAGDCAIEAATDAESGTPLASPLRWSAAGGALVSPGHNAQSVTEALNHSADQSNNFGSFLFMPALTLEEMAQAAEFSHISNCGYMYCQRVSTSTAAGVSGRLQGYDGAALTEYDPARAGEFPEMAPMLLLAATEYARLNGGISYMFQQFGGLTPTVTDNAKANLLDGLRVNYYGRTQQAGQLLDFYQRGILLGAFPDMNVYANEMWLKDRIGADIMSLNLALNKISANEAGRITIYGCLQNAIGLALNNGAISVNKPLNTAQKAFIKQISGDEAAWAQIQSQGWWLNVELREIQNGDRTEFEAWYLLIYAKDDVIRKVEGTHSLI
jgi:hypothetical protein